MLILEAKNIKKYYGDRLIVSIQNLEIHKGDKIGIIGQNGAGKTTFLDILAGDTKDYEGVIRRHCEIEYIKQFSDVNKEADLKILKEFGVSNRLDSDKLSGGEISKLKIAKAFSSGNTILFADEPTSNLDYSGIKLLSEKLREVETLLLVTHDRNLMDSFCNKIIEIIDGRVRLFEGNFSSYQEQKNLEAQHDCLKYEKYIRKKEELKRAVLDRQKRSNSTKKAPKRMGISEARLHKGKTSELV